MTRRKNSVFLCQALYKTHYLCPKPHCLVVTIVVGPWSTCLLDPSCVSWVTSKQGMGFSHTIYTAIYASPCPPLQLLLETSFLAIAGVTLFFDWVSLHFPTAPSMLCFTKKAPGASLLSQLPRWGPSPSASRSPSLKHFQYQFNLTVLFRWPILWLEPNLNCLELCGPTLLLSEVAK